MNFKGTLTLTDSEISAVGFLCTAFNSVRTNSPAGLMLALTHLFECTDCAAGFELVDQKTRALMKMPEPQENEQAN